MNLCDIYQGVGVYIGEALRSVKGSSARKISVSNSDRNAINKAIKFLEFMGIKRKNIQLIIHKPEHFLKKIEPIKGFKEIKVRVRSDIKIPTFEMRYFSKELREKIDKFINKIIYLKNLDKELALDVLRGLFAAEGRVKVTKEGKLNALCISSTRNADRKFISYLLNVFDFDYYWSRDEVYINGYFNFLKFKELRLYTLNKTKSLKFEKSLGLLGLSDKIPGKTKNEMINKLKDGFYTRFEISEILKKHPDTIYFHLKDLKKLGIVKSYKKGKNFLYTTEISPGATAE